VEPLRCVSTEFKTLANITITREQECVWWIFSTREVTPPMAFEICYYLIRVNPESYWKPEYLEKAFSGKGASL